MWARHSAVLKASSFRSPSDLLAAVSKFILPHYAGPVWSQAGCHGSPDRINLHPSANSAEAHCTPRFVRQSLHDCAVKVLSDSAMGCEFGRSMTRFSECSRNSGTGFRFPLFLELFTSNSLLSSISSLRFENVRCVYSSYHEAVFRAGRVRELN